MQGGVKQLAPRLHVFNAFTCACACLRAPHGAGLGVQFSVTGTRQPTLTTFLRTSSRMYRLRCLQLLETETYGPSRMTFGFVSPIHLETNSILQSRPATMQLSGSCGVGSIESSRPKIWLKRDWDVLVSARVLVDMVSKTKAVRHAHSLEWPICICLPKAPFLTTTRTAEVAPV